MTSNTDLRKLTVPQLKALCKERRITGYSKLSKATLLQRLAEVVAPAHTAVPWNDQTGPGATIAASADEVHNPASIKLSTVSTQQPVQQVVPVTLASDATESTRTSALKVPAQLSSSPQGRTVTRCITSTLKPPGTKRHAHIDISTPPKRVRTFPKTNDSGQQSFPAPNSSVFKVPELPARPKTFLHTSTSTPAKEPSGAHKLSVVPRQVTGFPGRFKPLVISRPVEPGQANKEPSRIPAVSVTQGTDPPLAFTPKLPLLLSYISIPPNASQRKWVYRWAIILSALSPADRQACTLVSRTFRYAVYLSAAHILSKDYPGRRLDAILEQHPRNMTNLWPYLRFRMTEVSERRQVFRRSFLGQYAESIGYDPLSKRLWTSPDDEKQVEIALRFVHPNTGDTYRDHAERASWIGKPWPLDLDKLKQFLESSGGAPQ